MMTIEKRIPLRVAEPLAQRVRNRLAATCEQIEIAGSIRRQSADVKDAEIVAIPTNATYAVIENMVASGEWQKAEYGVDRTHRWGMSYRGIDVVERNDRGEYDRLRVEVFFAELDSWGYQLALRTGPGDANRNLMYYTHTTPVRCANGAVWYAEDWEAVATADGTEWRSETRRQVLVWTETMWFALWSMPLVPAPARRADLYAGARFDAAAMLLDDSPVIRQQALF